MKLFYTVMNRDKETKKRQRIIKQLYTVGITSLFQLKNKWRELCYRKKTGIGAVEKGSLERIVGLEDVTILNEDIRHKWTLKYRCLLCCLLSLQWSRWAVQPLSGLLETVHRDQSQELRNHERDQENGFVAKKAKNLPSTRVLWERATVGARERNGKRDKVVLGRELYSTKQTRKATQRTRNLKENRDLSLYISSACKLL